MLKLSRLLFILIAIELLACGYYAAQRLGQHLPVLPVLDDDDPLLKSELAALGAATRGGTSRDWQRFGEGLLGQGFYGEAELAFRRAMELDPQNATAQFSLAFCVDRTGRIAESTREYLRAAEIARHSTSPVGSREHCLYQVGRNALREERPADAERLFHEIIHFIPAAYQHGKLLVRSDRSAAALPEIDKVLQQTPRSLKFQGLRLHALESLGQRDAAAESARLLERSEYQFPIDLGTNFVEPLSQRLGINREVEACNRLLTAGNMDRLSQKLNELLVLLEPTSHPQKLLFRKSLVEVEFQRRNVGLMLASIERLHADGVFDADLLQMEGAAQALQGDMPRAVRLWQRALLSSPNVPLHQLLARHYDQTGDAPRRDQHLGQAALLTTKIHYWNNQLDAAQKAVTQAKQLAADDAHVWFYSAEIERSLGHSEPARADYRRCVELHPGHGRAARALQSFKE